jgi:hypothetical protein
MSENYHKTKYDEACEKVATLGQFSKLIKLLPREHPHLITNEADSKVFVFALMRFLYIKTISMSRGVEVSPSLNIDMVWHTTMMMPVLYAQMCSVVQGKNAREATLDAIIDHDPFGGDGLKVAREVRYLQTLKLLVELFPSHSLLEKALLWPSEIDDIGRAYTGTGVLPVKNEIKKRKCDDTDSFRINVKYLEEVVSFKVHGGITVGILKVSLEKHFNILPDEYRLIWASKQLKNDDTLLQIGAGPDDTMYMVKSLRGC